MLLPQPCRCALYSCEVHAFCHRGLIPGIITNNNYNYCLNCHAGGCRAHCTHDNFTSRGLMEIQIKSCLQSHSAVLVIKPLIKKIQRISQIQCACHGFHANIFNPVLFIFLVLVDQKKFYPS